MKKEFKIGEEFVFGLGKMRVEPSDGVCKGCFFNLCKNCFALQKFIGECLGVCRGDNTNVKFVQVEEDGHDDNV